MSNTISAFSSYFCIGAAGLRHSPWIQRRFEYIQQRLQKHQGALLEKALKSSTLNAWQSEQPTLNHLEIITPVFSAWVKFITEVRPLSQQQKNWIALQRAFKAEHLPDAVLLLTSFNDATRLLLNDAELIWCHEQQRLVENALTHQKQRYQCSLQASAVSKHTSIELWRQIDSNGVEYERDELTQQIRQLLQTWPERTLSQPAIVGELEFLANFVEWLIVPKALPREAWSLLLLLLEQQLDPLPEQPLSGVLSVLMNAIPRFEFIRSLWQHTATDYQPISMPVLRFLSLFILFQAQPDSNLAVRFNRHLEPTELLQVLAPQLKTLINAHRQALDKLRPLWERSQLDWLAEAIERFNNLLLYSQHNQLLLQQLGDWQTESAVHLSEALGDGIEPSAIEQVLVECVYLAGQVAALSLLPQLARDLFKRNLTLYLGPDSSQKIWQKPALMQRVLEKIESNDPRCQKLVRETYPLLSNFKEIIEDNLQFAGNWFGTATVLQTVVSEHPGCRHLALVMTLRMLASYRRLYVHHSAVQELQYWYLRTILRDPPEQIQPAAIYTAFLGVSKILQERTQNPSPPPLMQTLQLFIESLPDMLASRRLPPIKQVVANLASTYILTTRPELAAQLGKEGLQHLIQDNQLLLTQVARVLPLTPQQGRAQLLRWWYSAYERVISPQSNQVHEANLAGLYSAIKNELTSPEVERTFNLIVDLYEAALAVNYRPEKSKSVKFNALTIEGPIWQRFFAKAGDGLLGQHTQVIQELGQGVGEQFSQREGAAVLNQLNTFFDFLAQHGDLEAAWQNVQPLFDVSLQTLGSVQLEKQWQYVILQLPRHLKPAQAAYWETLLQMGITQLRQVALGRQLLLHAERTATEVVAKVSLSTGLTKGAKRRLEQALSQWLQFFADSLRSQSPSLVALNVGRYLQEVILPQINQPATIWHLVWMQLEVTFSPQLTQGERLALSRWILQLQASTELLPELRDLVEQVFQARDFMFAETPREEQNWRDCISSLMVSAITAPNAPITSRMLVQRLLLSSPVLANETASSWQQHSTALSEAFSEWLPTSIRGSLTERHAELISSLLTLNQLENLELTIPPIGIYCVLLNANQETHLVWQTWLLARYEQDQQPPKPSELFISQMQSWLNPTTALLQTALTRYQEACQFQAELKLVARRQRGLKGLFARVGSNYFEVGEQDLRQLRLLVRYLARQQLFNGETDSQLSTEAVFEYLLVHLENYDSEEQQAIFTALSDALETRYGQRHKLSLIFNGIADKMPPLTLACRLLNSHQIWAEKAFATLPTELTQTTNNLPNERQRLLVLMQFALYRLGLLLIHIQPVSVEQWWQEITWLLSGSRLKPQNIGQWLESLPTTLNTEITREEAQLLETVLEQAAVCWQTA